MTNRNRIEIHSYPSRDPQGDAADLWNVPCEESDRWPAAVLAIGHEQRDWLYLGVDPRSGEILPRDDPADAVAAVRVVERRFSSVLALRALRDGILVNGVPALSLTTLAPRDTVLLSPGALGYVTERIRPYVGPPDVEHLGKKCPVCRLKIVAATRIVAHRCGVAYHHESAESHPDVNDEDRLKCFSQIEKCLSCGRIATLNETLSWDPAEVA